MAISPALLEFSAILDAVAFIITLLVATTGFRLYRTFRKPSYLQFSTGVLLMSTSYMFFSLINLLSYVGEIQAQLFLNHQQLQRLLLLFTEVRIVAMMLGLLTLTYLYYDIKEWRLRALLGLLMLFALFLGAANDFTFFMLSALFLLFITLKLYDHYRRDPQRAGLFVLMGFALLFIAKLLSSLLFLHDGIFLISYIFKLAGVLAILMSLWVISR